MTSTDTTQGTGGLKPARRTIVKGAAWAVPVVTVASAAPAMAASGSVTLIQTGACKSPGQSCDAFPFGYKFTFSATNTWPCDVTITSGTITDIVGTTPGTLSLAVPITVPTGSTPALVVQVNGTNSGNSSFTAKLCYTYTVSCRTLDPITECTNIDVTGTPPECGCPGGMSASLADESVESTVEEPAAKTTVTETVEEPAPGADTESSTASPQG